MPLVWTVALSKGGSTKTTTAAELVAALSRRGRRVLAVDLDQQGNFTTRMGIGRRTAVDAVAADVLAGEASAMEAAIPARDLVGVDVLAGTHDLASLEYRPEVVACLRDQVATWTQWDAVVIDTPPAMGVVTLAGLAAAHQVVASVACETEAYDQLDRLVEIIAKRVAPTLQPGLELTWIVPTRHDARRLLDRDVLGALERRLPGRVTPPIRDAVAVRDAYTAGMPVSVYDPESGVARDYEIAMATIIDKLA